MIKKSQSILGDIFVTLFFLIIILSLIWIFFEHIPPQISSIKEQKSCAEAETVSKFFLETNESDIALEHLILNYTEFQKKNYSKALKESGSKTSFMISYDIYAFNNDVRDGLSSVNPSANFYPSVYILRDWDEIIVRSGSSSVSSSVSLELFFPLISIDNITNKNNLEYTYHNYTPSTDFKTSSVEVSGEIIAGAANGEVNISLKEIPNVIYIKQVSCESNCSVYIGNNESKVSDEISSGEIYLEKDFCFIRRKGIIKRYEDTYSADIEIVAW